LVSKYLDTVPQAKRGVNDHAFIERLCSDTGGYHAVELGITELSFRVAAGLVPKRPLLYLRKIIASAPWESSIHQDPISRHGLKPGDHGSGLKQRLDEKEKKYADIYMS
jgi:hypothetical protein